VPQATAFWSTLPGYLLAVASVIERFLSAGKPANTGLEPALRSVGGAIVPFARGLLDAEAGLAAVASTLVLVLLMAVFWLVSSDTLRGFILSLLGPSARDGAAALLDEMGRKLRLYVSGTLVNGAIVALASTALLLWLRVPFAIVLGLLQGLLVAIPYLGTLIGVLAVGGVVLAGQGWVKAAEAVVLISLLEGFEGSFISPLIFKRGLDLAPLTTVLATAIGGGLLGIDGVVLALPAAVILQVIVVRLLAPAIRRFSKA
jgi:predicted PurR-regulated permease PerM